MKSIIVPYEISLFVAGKEMLPNEAMEIYLGIFNDIKKVLGEFYAEYDAKTETLTGKFSSGAVISVPLSVHIKIEGRTFSKAAGDRPIPTPTRRRKSSL